MLGAIIGDITGSIYEFNNFKSKEIAILDKGCFFTDDTVMTIAVADAIMKGGKPDDYIDCMKYWGRKYPNSGYGGRFSKWLFSDDREPYNSFGNGSAMRVSPCAYVVQRSQFIHEGIEDVENCARQSAEVTHNHPEGIKGAIVVAKSIYVVRKSYYQAQEHMDWVKSIVKGFAEEVGYNMNRSLDEIRPTYQFDETCQGSVSEAIIAFLESTNFVDAISNAISIGGDSDTIAAITGSIAEAAYGIPEAIKKAALGFLDEPMREVLRKWKKFAHNAPSGY
ncbi:MAG: ADP-ribosylglycohydrolase family protein [Spirochaetaceae bacterium]|jgi:ADP-ribosylglycohydrolase|nr:ADP-ribosylglycohydrolase family protein [Spirochaetaceae bacterium]